MVSLSQDGLAEASGVAVRTLISFEKGERKPHAHNIAKLQKTLEAAGVQFIDENGGGAGVRLAKS